LVPAERLEQANGVISGSNALTQIVSPILGGLLYGVFAFKTLVIFSCAAFFLASFLESFMRIPFVRRERTNSMISAITGDLREGFAYVATKSFIRKAMILAALLNFVLSPLFLVGAPIILRVTMQSADQMYGIGMSLISVASVAGALTIGAFIKMLRIETLHRWLILISLLLVPVMLSVAPVVLQIGYYPSFIAFMAGLIPIAMIATFLNIFVISRVQKETPNENLGKVMAIIMAAAQCAAPVGQALYGVVFEAFQTSVWLPVLLVCAAMLTLAAFTRQSMKNEGIFQEIDGEQIKGDSSTDRRQT
jgi:MFS family permease